MLLINCLNSCITLLLIIGMLSSAYFIVFLVLVDDGLALHCHTSLSLHAFSDANWAGNKDAYASTSAYIVYFGHNLISWFSKEQRTVAHSSIEADYHAIASTAAELSWICSLLTELGIYLPATPVIYCDNVGAQILSSIQE